MVDRNNSFVNRIYELIPNTRLNFSWVDEQVDKFDYTMLMYNPSNAYKADDLIKKYIELEKTYTHKINLIDNEVKNYEYIYQHVKYELSRFGYSDREVTDILVKYLYSGLEKPHKNVLWSCYGDYIVMNLKNNISTNGEKMKIVQCIDCGEYIEVPNKDTMTCRCYYCNTVYRRHYKAIKEKERRAKIKAWTDQNENSNDQES